MSIRIGITPARGGSKRIPRKNIRLLAGKPLIAWTIEAALESKLLDRYLVSTENPEIAEVARRCGAEVLERPKELATDETSTLQVLQHLLSKAQAETVVLLQATSPIREDGLVDRCIRRFMESQADSLATGWICKHTEYGQNSLRRQDVPGFFCDDGNVYIMRAEQILQGDRYGQRIERILLDREQNLDIDDEFDFWLAEQILLRHAKAVDTVR